jgi:rhodanese-related sulfurtransferase
MQNIKNHPGLFLVIYIFLSSILFIQCKGQSNAAVEDQNVIEEIVEITSVSIASLDSLKGVHPDYVLLDVRTPKETAEGMIPGAIEVDYKATDFKSKLRDLEKDKTYLIYCRSGRRSLNTAKIMDEMGFEKVIDLAGGHKRWLSTKTEN